mgnify:FL=1
MSILPDNADLRTELKYADQPTNTFIIDWASKQVSRMDSGLDAMRQAVEIILQNERYHWQIYTSNFGSELEGLVGEEYAFIVSELPRRILDAFSVDRRILSAENFVFEERSGSLHCAFDVITVFGTIREEMAV